MERQAELYQIIRLLCAEPHKSKSGLLEKSTAAWTRSDSHDLDTRLTEKREARLEQPRSDTASMPCARNQAPRERADLRVFRHVISAGRNDANGGGGKNPIPAWERLQQARRLVAFSGGGKIP